jgi:D-sedoheptulose 7-phosphate isomerase
MEHLEGYLSQVVRTVQQLPQPPLERIASALWGAYERDATIFVCGNGGSAATASHFACDLSKWTIHGRARRVRAIALTDNVPLLTAWSNDQGYADVFVEQLRALYRPGDLVVAISGSGKSPNVVRAVQWAGTEGATTVGITGFDGGQLARSAEIVLRVNSSSMPQIEDVHSMICHALAVNLGRQIEQVLRPAPVSALLQHAIGGGGA